MKWFDRIRETTTTEGTITAVLAGAFRGHKRFSDVFSNGDLVPYCIAHQTGTQFEVGLGTYTASNQLARTKVLAGSNGTSLVDFQAGTKDVLHSTPAAVVDGGAKIKTPCRVATTASVALSTDLENGDSLNGVTLATGDRVLVWQQSTASQNGIYIVQASGAAVRALDLWAGDGASGLMVSVLAGTTYSGGLFLCTTASGSDVVGTDNLTFAQLNSLDATLAALAALTIVDEGLLVGTGADAFEVVTMATHVGTLIRSADAAAARSAISAVSQTEIDSAIRGLDWKASCRVATTANITLSGEQTIDGVSVIAGDSVLVKNQSTGAENGLYLCAAGAWTRRTDADVSAEVTSGLAVSITEGTTNGNTVWVMTTDDPITLATTALVFTQLAAGLSDGSVTNPKLADMAAATIKGRASGAGTGVPTDLTAAQVRTILGYPARTVISYSGTPTLDVSANDKFDITLTGNPTFTFSNSVTDKLFLLIVQQDGTGGRTITWPAGVHWVTGLGTPTVGPTLSVGAAQIDVVGFWCTGTDDYLGFIVGLDEVA